MREVVSLRDPGTGRAMLFIATGPWDQTGMGFGIHSYRWTEKGTFRNLNDAVKTVPLDELPEILAEEIQRQLEEGDG